MTAATLSLMAATLSLASFYYGREQSRIARLALRREWLLLIAIRQLSLDVGEDVVSRRMGVFVLELQRQQEHDGDFRMPPALHLAWPEDRT